MLPDQTLHYKGFGTNVVKTNVNIANVVGVDFAKQIFLSLVFRKKNLEQKLP